MAFLVCILIFMLAWCIFGLYNKNTNAVAKSKKRLEGKVAVVTGGTMGMGLQIANDFAHRGAKVIIACPYKDEGERAQKKLITRTNNNQVIFKLLDLSSLESVRQFARDILENEDRLDILVNNAGVGPVCDVMTNDKINFIMQVNYFGHFLLTMLLLPLLIKTGTPAEPSRIVNTSSIMRYFGKIDFQNWNTTGYWWPLRLYSNSKLCMLWFSRALSERLKGTYVVANSVDPGAVGTRIYSTFYNSINAFLVWFFFCAFCKTPWEGAQTAIYVSVDDKPSKISGQLFRNCSVVKSETFNKEIINNFWKESCNLVKYNDDNFNNNYVR